MQITSTPVGGSAHFLTDASHASQTESAVDAHASAHAVTTGAPTSLASIVPNGGLHPVAGEQTPNAAKKGGGTLFAELRALLNEAIFCAVMDAKSAKVPVTKG